MKQLLPVNHLLQRRLIMDFMWLEKLNTHLCMFRRFAKCILVLTMLLVCLLLSHVSVAQKRESPKPSWIIMMDDPNVNYFEAVKAFNAYWKHKEKPVEENELFESVKDKEKEEKLERKRKNLSEDDPAKLYAFEYKRFLWWKEQVEPFVLPDGRIKSMDERIEEWKVQKQHKQAKGVKQQKKSPNSEKKN